VFGASKDDSLSCHAWGSQVQTLVSELQPKLPDLERTKSRSRAMLTCYEGGQSTDLPAVEAGSHQVQVMWLTQVARITSGMSTTATGPSRAPGHAQIGWQGGDVLIPRSPLPPTETAAS
jgi:hypothetical protein